MHKIIIFDLFRTLYDPETDTLMENAEELLRELKKRGYTLYLVSNLGSSGKKLLLTLGIDKYFDETLFNYQKTLEDFKNIFDDPGVDKNHSYVVGDSLTNEIYLGNRCGVKTIWFEHEYARKPNPHSPLETPTYTIHSLLEMWDITS